jgi:hypothetical protein
MRKGIKKFFDFGIFVFSADGFARFFRVINIKQVRWGK